MSRESFNSFIVIIFIIFISYKFLRNFKNKKVKSKWNKYYNNFWEHEKIYQNNFSKNWSIQKVFYKWDIKKNKSVEVKKVDDYVLNLDVVKYKLKNSLSNNLKDENTDF